MSDSRDENLLFGILALQLDFITQDQLIGAANAWMVSKTRGLDEILVKLNSISLEDREFVGLIVKKHIARSGSPKSSLEMLKQHESASNTESQVETILHGGTADNSEIGPIQHDGTAIWIPSQGSSNARFVRLRELASGGLGVVSVARDQELNREVALKEMIQRKRLSPDAFERFVAEAKITGNLEHPGIVPIYGLGTTADGSPYYAMRLIRGKSLREEIESLHDVRGQRKPKRNFRSLDSEHLRRLLRSLTLACYAVAYAHSRGVIHRDLKPSNIMLGKFGETIVVDWGLAKVTGVSEESQMRSEPPVRDSRDSHDSETVMGAVLGTPSYMSPEQADGRIDMIDRRSDVFGLGACLYAILTNVAPFKANSRAESIANARAYRLKTLRQVDSQIPAALDAICLKAMASEAKCRYLTATEFAEDIDRWIAGEAVAAMPDHFVQRVFRWARRHQTLVATSAALLLTTLVGLSIASVMISEQRNIARSERDRANRAAAESEQQRKNADHALTRSTESNAVSLSILEKFVEGLGDDGWAEVPQMETKRIEMVDLAVARFQKLYAENPTELDVKVKLVRLLVRSANLYRMVGKFYKASEHFSEAMTLIDSLNQNDQLKEVGLSLVGDSLYAYTNLIEEQQGATAALVSCKQGMVICRKRMLIEPNAPLAKLGLAMALIQLASLQLDVSELENAISAAIEGQNLLRTLSKTSLAQQAFFPLFDIIAYEIQIKAILRQGKAGNVDHLMQEAVKTCNTAKIKFPNDNNIEYFVLQLNRSDAQLSFARRQFAEGVTKLLNTIEAMKKLASKYPETIEYQRNVNALYAELGIEVLLNDDLTKAKEYSSLSMSGIDIAKLGEELTIGALKTSVTALALELAIIRRGGTDSAELSSIFKQTYNRLKLSTPDCEAIQQVLRISLVQFNN